MNNIFWILYSLSVGFIASLLLSGSTGYPMVSSIFVILFLVIIALDSWFSSELRNQ